MSNLGLTVLNSNPGRITQKPGFSGGSVNSDLNKAIDVLKAYTQGGGLKKPNKKMLDLLEKHKVISKQPKLAVMPRMPRNKAKVPEMPEVEGGKINRLKKANRWANFSKKQVKDGIDLGSYGYDQYSKATNPLQYAATNALSGKGYQQAGAMAKGPSKWILHVKAYSKEHNISYKDALKKASPSYHAKK